MPQYSTDRKTAMRSSYAATLLDECEWHKRSDGTQSPTGAKQETWTKQGAAMACGIEEKPGMEQHQDEKTVITWDATLRLPYSAGALGIKAQDRIKITKRWNEAASQMWEAVSPVQLGVIGCRLHIKRVEV